MKYSKSLFVLVFIIFSFFIPTRHAYADYSSWQKGFTLRLNNQSIGQVDTSLAQLAQDGANFLTLSPGWITSSTTSSNVDRKSSTPPDSLVIYTINKAHSLGMRVMVKPHLDISSGQWRANLNPTNKQTFFNNYTNMIITYANIAQQTGTEQLSIGAELVSLSTNVNNKPYWLTLINTVRAVYTGQLTYSANASKSDAFNELGKLTFWNELDIAGFSFYGALSTSNNPSVSSLLDEWANWDQTYILPNFNSIQKPMIITEIGYRSVDGAAKAPWDYTLNNSPDPQEQKDLYTAFFEYWKDKNHIQGVHFWEWEAGTSIDPNTDKDYTPQFKPAEDLVKNYFGGAVPVPPTNTSGLINNLNKYIKGTINAGVTYYLDRSYTVISLPGVLQNEEFIKTNNVDKNATSVNFLTFTLSEEAYVYIAYDSRATNLPGWMSNYIKTTETIKTTDITFNIYKSAYPAGEVVLGGNMAAPASGAQSNYFVVVSKNSLPEQTSYSGSDPAPAPDPDPVPDPDPAPTPPPTEGGESEIKGDLVVVTPKDNSTMSGEKKIKVYIPGVNLNDYTASYDVDSRGDINMPTDSTGKYKQAKVDFDKWDWNGDGPYNILITAKDLNGKLIDTITVVLFVNH